ncbi:hypothetical protein CR513_60519, partial [Mucuna pruriens]
MQVMCTIKAHKLQKFLNEEDKQLGKVNEAYEFWEQQDQYVFTWLLSSMSLNLHTIKVECKYTYQIWIKLHVYFASQTRAKVSQLKIQLKNIKKTRGINDYLLSIKKIVDTLTAINSPIDTVEHIEIILDGLPNEYNPIFTSILSQTNAYIVLDIESLFMNIEGRIEKQKVSNSDAFSMHLLQASLSQNQ